VVVTWWIFRCSYRPQHAGGGEGALTVRHLIERVEAETGSGGRHRLREPIMSRRDLADDITDDETQTFVWPSEVWAADQSYARNPLVLRRILAGLRHL
jgi:hypothetical protein